jgi:hypothetical protein
MFDLTFGYRFGQDAFCGNATNLRETLFGQYHARGNANEDSARVRPTQKTRTD